jgi:hypothetical protein
MLSRNPFQKRQSGKILINALDRSRVGGRLFFTRIKTPLLAIKKAVPLCTAPHSSWERFVVLAALRPLFLSREEEHHQESVASNDACGDDEASSGTPKSDE